MVNQVIVDVFVSVDGWAGSDGLPGHFGYLGPELAEWIAAEGESPQQVLLGRRTYETLAGVPEEFRDDGWYRLSRLPKVVFSRGLDTVDWPNSRISRRDPVEEVASLEATGELPLRTVGSLSVARRLLDAGLVDRLRLMVFPLVAGPRGREQLFADVGPVDLDLVGVRVLDDRILLVEYRPTGRAIPTA